MSQKKANNPARGRITFLAIVAIYATTLTTAWIWASNSERFKISETTNNGTLIKPPRPISLDDSIELDGFAAEDALRRIWTMMYVSADGCDAGCLERLYRMRQVRLTLGPQRMERVQGLLLYSGDLSAETTAELAKEHQGILLERLQNTQRIRDALSEIYGPDFARQGHIFLIDPFGNLMMEYDGEASPYAIKKDLKHLLKVSRAG